MKLVIAMLAMVLALAGYARAEDAVPSATPAAPVGETAGPAVRPAVAEAASGGVVRNPFQDGTPAGYDQLVDQNRQLRLQVEIAERQARLAELRAKAAVAEAAARAALAPPKPIVVEVPKPAPEAPKPVVQATVPAVQPAVPASRPQSVRRATGEGGGTRLVGFVGQAGELRALVQSGGKVVAVRSGDQVGGGTVQAIEPGQVTIGHGKGRRTLTTRIGPGEIAEPQGGGLGSGTAGRGASSQPVTMAGNGGMSPALMGSLGLAPAPLPSSLPPVPGTGR